jgi:hypothetical protein
MADAAISPDQATDTRTSEVELPCSVDDLMIDGTAPEVGDTVDVKVGATITRVVNGIAWLKPTKIQNKPLPETPMEPADDLSELDRTYQMSKQSRGISGGMMDMGGQGY